MTGVNSLGEAGLRYCPYPDRLIQTQAQSRLLSCLFLAIPENKEFKKWKFSFFYQRHALSTSFDIFVVTYRVTNFLPKLLHMLLFCMEKTEFPFMVFPYFQVMLPFLN